MDDKILLEDDIIDLTDLLEEGSPPKKTPQVEPQKKRVAEPDSFDLGKEISMDYDVSIEEIEHESTALAGEAVPEGGKQPRIKPEDEMGELLKEPLGGIESEIDRAMQEKLEGVSLTAKEEEALLQETPAEELSPIQEEEAAALAEEPLELLEEPAPVEPVVSQEPAPVTTEEPPLPPVEIPRATMPVEMPTEAIVEAVVDEFKKDMPALLEGIIRPVVKELLQEVISATRESLPGIVEKVIREEIDRLKKL